MRKDQFNTYIDILDKYLTLHQASGLAECNIKASSLRLAIRRGKLPATKFGNTWLVRYSDITTYLKNRKVGRPRLTKP